MLAPSLIRPGHVFGKYTLVKPLGEGGYGGVWLAERITNHQKLQLNRRVALKLRHRHESQTDMHDANLSFLRDWYVGNLIQHPNIVAIQDVVTEGPDIAIVMEWVDGYTFGEIIRRLIALEVFLPLAAVLEAGIGVCAGLHALHTVRRPDGTPYNIVHRDIKPPNLMIDLHGVVRVLDLGIAKSDELPGDRTATGIATGTKEYMAPEQYMSDALSPATDLFAVGAVLFELATKERLFRSDAEDEYLLKRKRGGHAVSRLIAHEHLLGPLVPLLRSCLSIEAEDRPRSAEALGQTLQSLLDSAPRGPGLRELMSALRGEIPPRMAQNPEWAPLALALDRPRRPTPVVHVPRNLAGLLPELDAPQTIAGALEPLDEDEGLGARQDAPPPDDLPLDGSALDGSALDDPPLDGSALDAPPLDGLQETIAADFASPSPAPTPEVDAPPAWAKRPTLPDEPTRSLPVAPVPVALSDQATLIKPQHGSAPRVLSQSSPPRLEAARQEAARGITPTPPLPPTRPPPRTAAPPPPLMGAAVVPPKAPVPVAVTPLSAAVAKPMHKPKADDTTGRRPIFIVAVAMMAGVVLAGGLLAVSQVMFSGAEVGPKVALVEAAAPDPAQAEPNEPKDPEPPGDTIPPAEADPCDGVADNDGDGFLPCAPSTDAALARVRAGELKANDCDDKDLKVYPGAKGDKRGVDNNCDGKISGSEQAVGEAPPPPQAVETCFRDMDGDGYGDKRKPLQGEACRGKNVSTNSDDCVDTDPKKYPGAPEPPGIIDYNCDGVTTQLPKPPAPRLLSVKSEMQGLGKKLNVTVKLDPNAGQCSALYVVTSGTVSFNAGETVTHKVSGGPTDWRLTASVDQKELYFQLKCSDAAQGTLERIGDKYYQVSP